MLAKLTLCALLLAAPAFPADGEAFNFDRVVSEAEKHFGQRRMRIPFLGLATFLTGAARPLGASGFDLAIFEDVGRVRSFTPKLGAGWRPVIRLREHDREETVIWGRDEGSWIHMLLVNQDGGDAVVMQFRLRPTRFLEYIAQKAREQH